jgi:EAL domain-containing protein (putative c-di-GMP-specific phosphodiesterase class I)
MAASLGMRTVAEGVETEAQLDFLRARGCDYLQGYWLARPLAVQDFERFVRARG